MLFGFVAHFVHIRYKFVYMCRWKILTSFDDKTSFNYTI